MMRTKMLPLLLAFVLILAGCSNGGDTATDTETTTLAATETEAAEVTEDGSAEGNESSEAEEFILNETDYKTGLTPDGYLENVTAGDFVTLFDHENVDIPVMVHMVPDSSVQAELDSIVSYFTTTEANMDKAVENGDVVNIDYVGSIDGVEFDGGNTGGAGTEVTIGVTSYIDDFLEQLIGHMPGETIDVNVTFPEDYQATELAGKDALFVTTINHINVSVVPELTDEFVAENLNEIDGWTTVAEMTDGIAEEIQKLAIQDYIQNELIGMVEIAEVPEAAYLYQKSIMLNYYNGVANQYGLPLDTFLEENTEWASQDELVVAYEEQLQEIAKYALVLQAVAEEADITVTEEDLKAYFLEFNGSEDYSEMEEMYGIEYLKYTILQEAVIEYLTDNAKLM